MIRGAALVLFGLAVGFVSSGGSWVAAAPVPKHLMKEPENPDLAALQGKWILTGVALDGTALPAPEMILEVNGNTFVTVDVRGKLRMTAAAELGATTNPRRVTFGDWKSTDLDGKPRANPGSAMGLGIYKLESGAFVLAVKCDNKDPAPADFTANPGSKTCTMTFTRAKK
jgi:uncharacterized protein (TIGR03067 family)